MVAGHAPRQHLSIAETSIQTSEHHPDAHGATATLNQDGRQAEEAQSIKMLHNQADEQLLSSLLTFNVHKCASRFGWHWVYMGACAIERGPKGTASTSLGSLGIAKNSAPCVHSPWSTRKAVHDQENRNPPR